MQTFQTMRREQGPALWCACLAAAWAVSACGGGDGGQDQAADPVGETPIVADAKLGRLVAAPSAADSQDAFKLIAQYFSQQAAFTSAADLQAGDVLLVDGRQVTADQLGAAGAIAQAALQRQVPILIVGFSDAFEEAIHDWMPSVSIPGYSSLALIQPPRAGQGTADGGIAMVTPDGSTDLGVGRSLTDPFIEQLRAFRAKSAAASPSAAKDAVSSCTNDPSQGLSCSWVVKYSPAPVQLVDPYNFNPGAFGNPTNCLKRNWVVWPNATDRNSHAIGRADKGNPNYGQRPQCPSQTWTITPVVYVSFPVNAPMSRVVYLSVDASFNPNLYEYNTAIADWYQVRHRLTVTPPQGANLLRHAPGTANGNTTTTSGFTWGISGTGSLTGGVQGGKPTFNGTLGLGWSVQYSHSTTNTIADWGVVDNTEPAQGVWVADFLQNEPYSGDSSVGCDAMGNTMFEWQSTHCHSLPDKVKTGQLKPLSIHTSMLSGAAVWDLTPANNDQKSVAFNLSGESWWDSVGCTVRSSENSWGTQYPDAWVFDTRKLSGPACKDNQFLYSLGTFYQRAYRSFPKQVILDLTKMPLPVVCYNQPDDPVECKKSGT